MPKIPDVGSAALLQKFHNKNRAAVLDYGYVLDPYDYGRSYLLTPIVLLSNIILVTIGNIHLSMLLND